MPDQAILIASFGTTHLDTLEKTIGAVERAVAAAFPDVVCRRAFTSNMIRASLARQGMEIPDVPSALESLRSEGIRRVVVLPTHLICGEEYDKVSFAVQNAQDQFESIAIAAPLITGIADMQAVLSVLRAELPHTAEEGIVLMGHGTGHWCNTVYAAMNHYASENGFPEFFIGTVEAWPDLDTVIASVRRSEYTRVVLTPLMLVAGDHAKNDMAGEWVAAFANAGVSVRPVIRGIGEYAGIQQLYCARVRSAMARA